MVVHQNSMAHHKIWESGRQPHKRPDKGKKKPQAIRQAKKRAKNLMKRLNQRDASFLYLLV
jgi:hypothetical protein